MVAGNAVQIDQQITCRDFGVDRLAFCVSLNTTCIEPKRLDEEIVRRTDVLIDENGDDSLYRGHDGEPPSLLTTRLTMGVRR